MFKFKINYFKHCIIIKIIFKKKRTRVLDVFDSNCTDIKSHIKNFIYSDKKKSYKIVLKFNVNYANNEFFRYCLESFFVVKIPFLLEIALKYEL